MNKQENKNTAWRMRASRTDKVNIATLKKRLKVRSQSEAVRRAIAHMLEITEPRHNASPISQPN